MKPKHRQRRPCGTAPSRTKSRLFLHLTLGCLSKMKFYTDVLVSLLKMAELFELRTFCDQMKKGTKQGQPVAAPNSPCQRFRAWFRQISLPQCLLLLGWNQSRQKPSHRDLHICTASYTPWFILSGGWFRDLWETCQIAVRQSVPGGLQTGPRPCFLPLIRTTA